VADLPKAEVEAQRWHDEQVRVNPEHEQFSSCWCCCWSCDPDATGDSGNPHFALATAGMRAEAASRATGSYAEGGESRG
jgi:hypothetical protein